MIETFIHLTSLVHFFLEEKEEIRFRKIEVSEKVSK